MELRKKDFNNVYYNNNYKNNINMNHLQKFDLGINNLLIKEKKKEKQNNKNSKYDTFGNLLNQKENDINKLINEKYNFKPSYIQLQIDPEPKNEKLNEQLSNLKDKLKIIKNSDNENINLNDRIIKIKIKN